MGGNGCDGQVGDGNGGVGYVGGWAGRWVGMAVKVRRVGGNGVAGEVEVCAATGVGMVFCGRGCPKCFKVTR